MAQKHSPVHPALRADFVTVPWRRRRRIDFNAWARVTAETERIPATPSAAVRPLPRSGILQRDRLPSQDGLAQMGQMLPEKTEEERSPQCR
jgi:hypothetical protein